jgi:hypothetical protein
MSRKTAPIFWVAILGAVPAAFYGWYFLGQRQRIAELNQRELGRAADNLQGILRNAVVNVSNLAKKQACTCTFLDRQKYLVMPPGRDCKDIHDKPSKKEGAFLQIEEDGLTVAAKAGTLKFRVQLERILDELVVGNGFEYLFVANGKGNVLLQTKRGERQRWIDRLRWVDFHARDESVKPASSLRLRNIADLRTDAEGKAGLQTLIKTTNSLRVDIAGEQYRLYVQPLGWPAEMKAESDSEGAIVLGGLVNARASIAEALAVEPRLALAAALLTGLALLTWPLLKFLVLAPGERFKFVDFHLLLLSTSALLSVCTVILLDQDNSRRLASTGEQRLEEMANDLAVGLTDELSKAAIQLSVYDAEWAKRDPIGCEELKKGKWFKERVKLYESPGTQELNASPPTSYRHLVSVFWVRGDDGMQFAKLTTMGQNTPRVNVSERSYFSEAREGNLWGIVPDVKPGNSEPKVKAAEPAPEFFVQIYRSITTGDFESGLSMPSRIHCVAKSKPDEPVFKNVAVLTTTLASLSPKAFPPDYGFMMIDRAGRVLYHSDPRRALREDLFEEVGAPERLRALAMAQRSAHITTEYRSVPHQLYIRPLRELVVKQPKAAGQLNGWFIVTFRDLQLSRTADGEATVRALVWCAIYFMCLQFAPALIFVVRGPKHNQWIWPNRAKQVMYRSLTIKLTVLAAGAIIAIVAAHGWVLAAASCLIGAGAMAAGTWEYLRWKDRQEQSGNPSADLPGTLPALQWGLAATALLFILISVLPAAGFFKFAWHRELGTLLAVQAKHVAQMKNDLKLKITDRARDQFADVYGAQWDTVVKGAIEEQEKAVGGDTPPDAAKAPESVDALAEWLPVYNDASAALRYEESKPDLVAGGNLSMRPGFFAMIGGVLLIGALLQWIRHWARHLLLSDLADIAPAGVDVMSEIEAARTDGRNLMIVTNSQTQEDAIERLVAAPAARAAAAASGGGDSQVWPAVQDQDRIFSLTEAFRNPESRLAGLARLEQIAAGGNGIVFSRVDPAAFLFRSVAAPSGGLDSQANSVPLDEWERRRWSDVLERFSLVLAPVPSDAAAEDAGKTADPARQPTRSEPLYWSLWNSCLNAEKLVLVHVAEEGFANPRVTQTVERLLRRGLLVMAPDLRPFHPDFRRFIQKAYEPKAMAEWERPARGIGWTQARWILSIVVVTAALFLFGTQRQALTPVVSFVSALTGTFAGILKLISEMTPKQRISE